MTAKHFMPFVLLSLAIAPIVLHAQEDNISVTASTIVGGGEIKNAKIIRIQVTQEMAEMFNEQLKAANMKTKDGGVITEIKKDDVITKGKISSGKLDTGIATKATIPSSALKDILIVDLKDDLVKISEMNDVKLIRATVKNVSFDIDTDLEVTRGTDQATFRLKNAPPELGTFVFNDVRLDGAKLEDVTIDRLAIAEPKTQKITTEASNIPLQGDFFQFKAKVSKFRLSDTGVGGPEVTAPKGACFRVSQEIPDVTQSDGSKSVMARGTFVTGWDGWPFGEKFGEWSYGFFTNLVLPPYICAGGFELKAAKPKIDPDASYDVPKQVLISDRDRLRFGWTYGILVAPFKYYAKTGEFNAGATVGPYLGYRLYDRPGAASVGALSIGTANATITVTDADGNKSSSTETGISTSVAWLVDVKNSFNVGFLAGKDYFSKSKNIPGSNKLWFSVSFGLNLN